MWTRWRNGCLALVAVWSLAWPHGPEARAEESGGASERPDLAPNARSAILMDAATGTILYEKNAHDRLPPASITKIMTMLLVMEAIEKGTLSLNEKVRTSEYAASMGGSQIFLEAGEEMTVEELLKGVALASGNDASVALAEKIAGTEELFVRMMNEKAKSLGMNNTQFRNSNGLPADGHYSTAYDIALVSRELLKHEAITKYTGLYQDYLRKDTDKPFWLVNTNKLVRFYEGADGLKTGYTSEAKFCLAATARRGHFRVIAVVMGEPDSKTRNEEVARMFDYAFSQYDTIPLYDTGDAIGSVRVEKGAVPSLELVAKHPYTVLVRKGEKKEALRTEIVWERVRAPVVYGQRVGKLNVYRGERLVAQFPLESPATVARAGWWTLVKRTAKRMFFVD